MFEKESVGSSEEEDEGVEEETQRSEESKRCRFDADLLSHFPTLLSHQIWLIWGKLC